MDILLSNDIKAVFFLPVLPITKREIIHSHKIQFILSEASSEQIIVQKIFKLSKNENIQKIYDHLSVSSHPNNTWSNEMIFITNYLRYFDKTKEITNILFNQFVTKDEIGFAEEFYMSQKDIELLLQENMIIGGHGYTSDILTETNQKIEISNTFNFISQYSSDFLFSYPNGKYNQETLKILKEINCNFAFTTKNETIQKASNLLELPRFDGAKLL